MYIACTCDCSYFLPKAYFLLLYILLDKENIYSHLSNNDENENNILYL